MNRSALGANVTNLTSINDGLTSFSVTDVDFISLYSNVSNNTTDSTGDLTTTSGARAGVRFEVPLLTTICVIGMLGNFIVLMVHSQRRLRRTNASLYISNLALGDFLALLVVVFHLTEFFKQTWPLLWRSDWACIILRYLRFVGFNITIFTMVAIAIDRYFAICYPMKFKLSFTLRRTRYVIVLLWVMAVLTAIPTGFMFKAIYQSDGHGVTYAGKSPFACKLVLPFGDWFKDFKAIYLNVVLFYLPVAMTAVAYTIIIYRVWRSAQEMTSCVSSQPYKNSHWKTARILFTVFIAYTLSYSILTTYNLLSRYFPNYNMHPMIKNIGLLLPYANSCMNPIIYSFLDEKFRLASFALICGKKLTSHQSEETRSLRLRVSSIRQSNYVVSSIDDNRDTGLANPSFDVHIGDEEKTLNEEKMICARCLQERFLETE